jgi:hypothetical protein
MKWLAASLVVLACSAGCHAPKPSFNVLAPYGSSRVPPPSTNSTARNAPYYSQPGGAPAGAAPAGTTNPTGGQPAGATVAPASPSLTSSAEAWRSVAMRSANGENPAAGGVELASFNSPASSGGQTSNPSSGTQLRLDGMPVNDASSNASTSTAPGLFVPDAGSNPIAGLPAPPPAVPAGTVVATAQASEQQQTTQRTASSSGTDGKPTLQWKTR